MHMAAAPDSLNTQTPDFASQRDAEAKSAAVAGAFANVSINKIEVLHNRCVPGADGALEHVVLANDQVTILRSSPLKGRVRTTKDEIFVGGVSLQLFLNGLEARVDTVRHLVGGRALVFGGIMLSKQGSTSVKYCGRTIIGSPRNVVEALIAGHCSAAQPSPHLKSLAAELDGMFLPYDKLREAG